VISLDISHDAQKQIISELEVLHRVGVVFLSSRHLQVSDMTVHIQI